MSELPEELKADVELRVPADGAFVYVLRTTAASLAARLDFTVDDVEDLRIAIGEAASLLVELANDGADLDCGFRMTPSTVSARLSTPSSSALPVISDSFAWQVLSTLTTSCSSAHVDGRAVVELQIDSSLAPAGDSATGALS